MNIQVLVVDDKPGAARTFASLISAETGLETFATNNPEEALEIVKDNDVKVVVLDQIFDLIAPPSTGTELFERMIEIDPGIRAIMFSGRAKDPDFLAGWRLRFADFVDKNELARLPDVVRDQYQQRLVAIAQERLGPAEVARSFHPKRGLRRPKVTVEVLGFDDITDAAGQVSGDWRQIARIDRGITTTYALERAITHEILVEEEVAEKASASAGLRLKFAGELKAAIESTNRRQQSTRFSQRLRASSEQRLFLDPNDPANVGVRARQFEAAQIYRRERAILRVSCDCCGNRQILSIPMQSWTGLLETRQLDYREGESEPEVHPTGTIDLR